MRFLVEIEKLALLEQALCTSTILAVIGVILPSMGLLGLVGNAISAFIYSRRSMQSSLNAYLCALAFSDMTIVSTSFFLFFLENMRKRSMQVSTYYALLAPIMFPLGLTAQTLSVFLTLAGAFDCFVLVVMRRVCCTLRTSKRAIFCIVISACCFNLPHIFEIRVVNCWSVPYKMPGYDVCPTALRLNETYYKWYYAYLYTIVMAAGPVLLLIVLNAAIIISMRRKYNGVSTAGSTSQQNKSTPLMPTGEPRHPKNAVSACRSVPHNLYFYKPRRIRSSEFSPIRIISTSSRRLQSGRAMTSNVRIQSDVSLFMNGHSTKFIAPTRDGYRFSTRAKPQLEYQPAMMANSTEHQILDSVQDSTLGKLPAELSASPIRNISSHSFRHFTSLDSECEGTPILEVTDFHDAVSPRPTHNIPSLTAKSALNSRLSMEDAPTCASFEQPHKNVEGMRVSHPRLNLTEQGVPKPDVSGGGGDDSADVITLVLVVFLFISCNILPLTVNFLEMLFNLVNSYLIDLSNLMVVLNSSCNFLIYYAFCKSFRTTLQKYSRELRARIFGKCFAANSFKKFPCKSSNLSRRSFSRKYIRSSNVASPYHEHRVFAQNCDVESEEPVFGD